MGPKGAKMSQVEAKLAGSCSQEAKKHPREATWRHVGNVGFKLGVYAPFSGDVGASWRQDGEQDGQDGDQEREDERR